MKQQINEIKRMQQLAGLLKENESYQPPIYEAINDLMDSIFQATGVEGRILPYSSIKWLPAVSVEDQNMDMLLYKKGNQEVAVGLDFEYGDKGDDSYSTVWQIDTNDPKLDSEFGLDLSFEEAENQIINWLES